MNSAVAIVPAAGASVRFGSMKLLATVQGVPLLERTLRSLLDAGVGRVVVVVAPGHGLDVPSLHDPRVNTVVNPDPSRGMFSSVQVGLAAADGDPILILPADMPFVPADVIATLADHARRSQTAVVPTHQGRRGHPVVIPVRLREVILVQPATSTLKLALSSAIGGPPDEVTVDEPGVLRDVDVPADLGE